MVGIIIIMIIIIIIIMLLVRMIIIIIIIITIPLLITLIISQVLVEEERVSTLRDELVHAERDEVDAGGVVVVHGARDLELGAFVVSLFIS